MKNVSILGAGWVGKALAYHLEQHYHIKASVQSKSSFNSLDIEDKFLLNSNNNYFHQDFYSTDTLVIAIPPRGEYLELLTRVLTYINPKTQLILLSSTSIYQQTHGRVIERDSHTIIENHSLMLQAEQLLQRKHPYLIILRLGGLMGYNRIAGKYSEGTTIRQNAPVNHIHRDDVVEIIKQIIEKSIRNEVFNAVAPKHPSKQELYNKNAKQFSFQPTTFERSEVEGRTISSQKLIEHLKYEFIYPNPCEFYTPSLAYS